MAKSAFDEMDDFLAPFFDGVSYTLSPKQADEVARAFRRFWIAEKWQPLLSMLDRTYGTPKYWLSRPIVIRDPAIGHLLPGKA